MKTVNLKYDGTFEGFLTLVFDTYDHKYDVIAIYPEHTFQPSLLYNTETVITCIEKVNRVSKIFRTYKNLAQMLYRAFLSEQRGVELTMLKGLQYVLKTGHEKDYGNEYLLKLAKLQKQVGREKHRMEAFIRFRQTKDALYFAKIEPDFNVLPLISKHFKKRYADQSWVIYDLKRKYGLYYDLNRVEVITLTLDTLTSDIWHESEADYDKLWKTYFKDTTIKNRINLQLHNRHVPKRYWKYLNEKHPF